MVSTQGAESCPKSDTWKPFPNALAQRAAHILTVPICHAVKKDPVLFRGSVFDKGDIVAGLNAQNRKEFQLLPGHSDAANLASLAKLRRDVQLGQPMRLALVVGVSLQTDPREERESHWSGEASLETEREPGKQKHVHSRKDQRTTRTRSCRFLDSCFVVWITK